MRCPCSSGLPYDECCGRFHRGDAHAPTAEALMRSRYSAFAVRDEAYLLATWHRTTRPPRLTLDDRDWRGLHVLATERGGPFDTAGTVEFAARYQGGVQRERSRFVREDKRWFYVDGETPRSPQS